VPGGLAHLGHAEVSALRSGRVALRVRRGAGVREPRGSDAWLQASRGRSCCPRWGRRVSGGFRRRRSRWGRGGRVRAAAWVLGCAGVGELRLRARACASTPRAPPRSRSRRPTGGGRRPSPRRRAAAARHRRDRPWRGGARRRRGLLRIDVGTRTGRRALPGLRALALAEGPRGGSCAATRPRARARGDVRRARRRDDLGRRRGVAGLRECAGAGDSHREARIPQGRAPSGIPEAQPQPSEGTCFPTPCGRRSVAATDRCRTARRRRTRSRAPITPPITRIARLEERERFARRSAASSSRRVDRAAGLGRRPVLSPVTSSPAPRRGSRATRWRGEPCPHRGLACTRSAEILPRARRGRERTARAARRRRRSAIRGPRARARRLRGPRPS
jgi:hypothetical protein